MAAQQSDEAGPWETEQSDDRAGMEDGGWKPATIAETMRRD
jgi:hypothetical protein